MFVFGEIILLAITVLEGTMQGYWREKLISDSTEP